MAESARNTSRPRGFTLIELLVVVGIVGILAAISIPQFGVSRERGFRAGIESDARNTATAEEAYFASNPAPGIPTSSAPRREPQHEPR